MFGARSTPLMSRRPLMLWLLTTAFHGQGGITCGEVGVAYALRAGLLAFLHQSLGGFVRAETPCDRGYAPHKIRPAHIGAGFLAVERRTIERDCVARPFSVAAEDRAGRESRERREH